MNISIRPDGCESFDAYVVGVWQSSSLPEHCASLDATLRGLLSAAIRAGDFRAKAGTAWVLPAPADFPHRRVVLAGLGPAAQYDEAAWRAAILAAVRATPGSRTIGFTALDWLPQGMTPLKAARLFPQLVHEAVYQAPTHKTRRLPPGPQLEAATLLSTKFVLSTALQQGCEIAKAVDWTRDLGNAPANMMTPTQLAGAAQMAAMEDGFECRVLRLGGIEDEGMGALAAVSKGSVEHPAFIILHYDGTHGESEPVALVGKGITFDSGGISLKPARNMQDMKFDMCGAAAVIATVRAAARLHLHTNVYGLVPACENLPSGIANKPGDVVTAANGMTIEIANTDAEGRLILADALSYAARLKPAATIDVATLTGACQVALGSVYSGLFCNDEALAASIRTAGAEAQDPVWRMPFGGAYDRQIESPVADVCNLASPPGGGACTAASFLAQFIGDRPWAHLDIAGTAWSEKHLATGRPAALLATWLCDRAGA